MSIRVAVDKIGSEQGHPGSIGSILYANSFISIDDSNNINLTDAVPNLLQWHTNSSHYMNTAKQAALHSDNAECALLGASTKEIIKNVQGLMPVKSEL